MSIQVPPLRHGLDPTQASCSKNQVITFFNCVVDNGVVTCVVEILEVFGNFWKFSEIFENVSYR